MNQSTEYKISCLSVNAKPEVNLLLYDSTTLEPLNNATNSLLSPSTCNALKLCTRVLQVNFMLNSQSSKLLTLNSLSCAAESVNSQFYTLASTSRLVNTDQANGIFFQLSDFKHPIDIHKFFKSFCHHIIDRNKVLFYAFYYEEHDFFKILTLYRIAPELLTKMCVFAIHCRVFFTTLFKNILG